MSEVPQDDVVFDDDDSYDISLLADDIGAMSITDQLEAVTSIAGMTNHDIELFKLAIDRGAPILKHGEFDVTLGMFDQELVTLGVQLAAIFAPELRDTARGFLQRIQLIASDVSKSIPIETKEEVTRILGEVQNEVLQERMRNIVAKELGVPVESVEVHDSEHKQTFSDHDEPALD